VGKTNLVLKMLDIQLASTQTIRETVGIDYKWGTVEPDGVKAGVNTYELGGGRALKDLLSAPLSHHNISNVGCVCICLDLSKPGNCYESLQFWLKVVKD
jgi:hypothetical protein